MLHPRNIFESFLAKLWLVYYISFYLHRLNVCEFLLNSWSSLSRFPSLSSHLDNFLCDNPVMVVTVTVSKFNTDLDLQSEKQL